MQHQERKQEMTITCKRGNEFEARFHQEASQPTGGLTLLKMEFSTHALPCNDPVYQTGRARPDVYFMTVFAGHVQAMLQSTTAWF